MAFSLCAAIASEQITTKIGGFGWWRIAASVLNAVVDSIAAAVKFDPLKGGGAQRSLSRPLKT
jgi:hypothetical protein